MSVLELGGCGVAEVVAQRVFFLLGERRLAHGAAIQTAAAAAKRPAAERTGQYASRTSQDSSHVRSECELHREEWREVHFVARITWRHCAVAGERAERSVDGVVS